MAEKFYHGAQKKASDKLAIHKFFTIRFSTSDNLVFNNC